MRIAIFSDVHGNPFALDAVLEAIGERFRAEGAPRDLTMIHPIAAGDMFGTVGAFANSAGGADLLDRADKFFGLGK